MATFTNCRAENNGLGGFVTSNPNSTFDNCTAVNNQGPGFIDISTSAEIGRHIVAIEQAVSADATLDKGRNEINQEIANIKMQLQTAQPKSAEVKNSLERILDMVKVAGAAKTTIDIVEKIPALINFIGTHAHLLVG